MIKDVMVHLDGTADDETRIAYGEMVASTWDGHLTGLFTNALPDYIAVSALDGGAGAAVIAELDQEARKAGDGIAARLAERLGRVATPYELRRVDGTPGMLINLAVAEARWADLFVAVRPYQRDDVNWDGLFETVLFQGGRAVLAVPAGGRPPAAFGSVMVCWRATRESVRAVAEALPFLSRATRSVLLMIDPETEIDGAKAEPEVDIAAHLARHGAQVEAKLVQSAGRGVAETILTEASVMGADLVVMGGYGHSRAREWILGGATRDVLRAAKVPVLIAH